MLLQVHSFNTNVNVNSDFIQHRIMKHLYCAYVCLITRKQFRSKFP